MSEGERDILVCGLVEDGPDLVGGSAKIPCAKCHKDCWVSPASKKVLVEEDVMVLCVEHAGDHAREGEVPTFVVTEDTVAEIAEALLRKPHL